MNGGPCGTPILTHTHTHTQLAPFCFHRRDPPRMPDGPEALSENPPRQTPATRLGMQLDPQNENLKQWFVQSSKFWGESGLAWVWIVTSRGI